MTDKIRPLFFLSLAAACALFPAPFAMILPGLALALLHDDEHPFALSIPLSMALWAILLQILYVVHAPSRAPVTIVLLLSAAVVARRLVILNIDRYVCGLLGVATLFRLIPAVIFPCASGIDMSFHTFLGSKIAEAAIPNTLLPLADGHVSGLPIGFHLIMSAFCMEPNGAGLWMSVAVYVVLTFALYRSLAGFFSPGASAFAALLIAFLSNRPQSAVRYGTHAYVLAAILLILAFALWAEGLRNSKGAIKPLPIALFFAGSVVVHPTPAYASLFLLVPSAIFFAFRRMTRGHAIRTLAAATLAALFVLPFVATAIARPPSPSTVEWTRAYHATVIPSLSNAGGLDWIIDFLNDIRNDFGPQFSALAGLALLYALLRKRSLALFLVAAIAGLILVGANTTHWFLPFSMLLYPDRAALLLSVPIAVIVAAGIDDCRLVPMFLRYSKLSAAAATILLALFAGQKAWSRYIVLYEQNVVVNRDDFEAMAWIRDNTPADAAFLNLPDDGGLWIPAFANRRITRPQGAPVYFELPKLNPSYLYVGMHAAERDPATIIKNSGLSATCEKLFERGKTSIYALHQSGNH